MAMARTPVLLFFVLVFAVLLAGCSQGPKPTPTTPSVPVSVVHAVPLAWRAPVDLHAIGYEPSLAVDSTGALFLTAHKDLQRPDTWPYLASWILVSTDHGATWHAPTSPGQVSQLYVGDEGDLAVDGRDWLYYIDTYAADNHLHVWADQGKTWKYSIPAQRTAGADDRPWIFAQGDGVVHYLGNNGEAQAGLRYFYYRSTDGGLTFTQRATDLPGAGWAHGAAQSRGQYAFILQEKTARPASELDVKRSSDQGATWSDVVKAGERKAGTFDGFPLIATDDEGNPAIVWEEADGVQDGAKDGATRILLGRSLDHGVTWTQTDITPFKAYIDHVVVAGGKGGRIAVAFYATKDLPISATSTWGVYAGMADGPISGPADLGFVRADPKVLYTGSDEHALHDFFEIVIDPQNALDVSYMTNLPPGAPNQTDGDRHLWFVRAESPSNAAATG